MNSINTTTTSSTSTTPLTFEDKPLRIIMDEQGNPWFNANDVCMQLEFGNPYQAIASHVDPEDLQKLEVLTAGGKQPTNHINESGLYTMIFGSTKPEAKRFKRWVTSEVLPSIRKTGQYQHPQTPPSAQLHLEEKEYHQDVFTPNGELVRIGDFSYLTNLLEIAPPVIESTHVAQLFDRPHYTLMQRVRCLLIPPDFHSQHFEFDTYEGYNGHELPMCKMTCDGFSMLTSNWRRPKEGRIKAAVYKAFSIKEAEEVWLQTKRLFRKAQEPVQNQPNKELTTLLKTLQQSMVPQPHNNWPQ